MLGLHDACGCDSVREEPISLSFSLLLSMLDADSATVPDLSEIL